MIQDIKIKVRQATYLQHRNNTKFYSVAIFKLNRTGGLDPNESARYVITKNWGKIGSRGQFKVEHHGSIYACDRESANMLRSKSKRGYDIVSRVSSEHTRTISSDLPKNKSVLDDIRSELGTQFDYRLLNEMLMAAYGESLQGDNHELEVLAEVVKSRPKGLIIPDDAPAVFGSW